MTLVLLATLLAQGAEPCPAPADSAKRGAAYHFCGWPFVKGGADLAAMKPGLSWYYNWSSKPMACEGGIGGQVDRGEVEFVPMVWGLFEGGARCAEGGPCFRVDERAGGARCAKVCEASNWSFAPDGDCYACYHEPVSRETFAADVPKSATYLLGYNEPNFHEQANLDPVTAARGWAHVQWVADQRGLKLVGPATNYCDPNPEVRHAGSCVAAVDGQAMMGLAWLERFYDACEDCRIDHQAVHAYSCDDVVHMVSKMKQKAGLEPPDAAHCGNKKRDADETSVDCGGNDCVACSERARAHFRKPVWLTEFAPVAGSCGEETPEALAARSERFLRDQVARLEADPFVFRYAWFMPRTDIPTLDHVDLLGDAGLSPLGSAYFCR